MAGEKTLTVVWGREGVPCPKVRKQIRIDAEGVDRSCIYGEPVEVPNTRYYRRRIAVGDLRVYTPPAKPKATPKARKSESDQ